MPGPPRPSLLPSGSGRLLDERSRPDLRDAFGQLMIGATRLAVAVRRIRLMGVDLTAGELAGISEIRVLLGGLDARTFGGEADAVMSDPDRRPAALNLLELARTGAVVVRVLPLSTWVPDFSVFSGEEGPVGAIVGFHWFQRPYPHGGPAFATVFKEGEARSIARRFEKLWDDAHDVTAGIVAILDRAHRRSGRETD